jgi:hypothetical protein
VQLRIMIMYRKQLGMALAGASLLICAAPAMADSIGSAPADPFFEITFNATGSATINACTSSCGAPYSEAGTAVTNVGGLGGNGYDYALPEVVTAGCCIYVDNSSGVLVGVLDFIDVTDMDYLVSGTLSNYTNVGSVTASAGGSFTYLGPYPTANEYDGTIPSTVGVPAPSAGTGMPGLIFAGSAMFVWWRRKRNAEAVSA